MRRLLLFMLILLSFTVFSKSAISTDPATISSTAIQSYDSYPQAVKKVIETSLTLTTKNLGYRYGSADPKTGAMDCSGTIYFILTTLGIKNTPRSSLSQYQWVREKGHFHPVNNNAQFDTAAFAQLKPGDLLFWSGTYQIDRNPNVTHVMIYLGKNIAGEHLMVGASDGRTYQGRKIFGVSVFDFKLPTVSSKSRFLGYSCIPNLTCSV